MDKLRQACFFGLPNYGATDLAQVEDPCCSASALANNWLCSDQGRTPEDGFRPIRLLRFSIFNGPAIRRFVLYQDWGMG
jgi:hypothetical protein